MVRSKVIFMICLSILGLIGCTFLGLAQTSSVYIEKVNLNTYPFSDPDPVPNFSKYYPYHNFSGYAHKGVETEWEMVVLENDYIKVYINPKVGGKVWGAIEKSTGKDFIYFNHAAKFRNVAMRGPWTSGGIEINFGTIGHAPTTASPVDYTYQKNEDGSVSCVVGSYDFTSRTRWNVEISLEADKAFFKTKTTWHNLSELSTSYYHWMTAAAKASGNLQFISAGTNSIGHVGEVKSWPIENGRDLSFYNKNNFGSHKSYHIVNSTSDLFGGYWHNEDFGFGHLSDFDEMPGKKIWIWSLSRQGGIWEDLLTDTDGQYVEWQAGKLFNQASPGSTYSPFKHQQFFAHDADVMEEVWFPLINTKGGVAASRYAVLNILQGEEQTEVFLCPLQSFSDQLVIYADGEEVFKKEIDFEILKTFSQKITLQKGSGLKIKIGQEKLLFEHNPESILLERPVKMDSTFNWESTYGQFIKGRELENQRMYLEAEEAYLKCLATDQHYIPAVTRLGYLHYRKGEYPKALEQAKKALAFNTYEPEANFLYGLTNKKLGKIDEAYSGFSIASSAISHRAASYLEMAKINLLEKKYQQALAYAEKSLRFNPNSLEALEIKAICFRISGDKTAAKETLSKISRNDATYLFPQVEKFLLENSELSQTTPELIIENEFPNQTLIEMGVHYYNLGQLFEAKLLFKQALNNPIANYWLAFLYDMEGNSEKAKGYIDQAITLPTEFVFPFRQESLEVFKFAQKVNNHWKTRYYQALLFASLNIENGAKNIFDELGEEPDIPHFYLARANFNKKDPPKYLDDLTYAYELDKHNWRALHALSEYYLNKKEAEKAIFYAKNAYNSYQNNSIIVLDYLKALNLNKEYSTALKVFESVVLLPYEGFSEARSVYFEACVNQAIFSVKSADFEEAIALAQKGSEWPENLGVGKPYLTDNRITDFITAISYERLGKGKLAKSYYQKVFDSRATDKSPLVPNFLLVVLAELKLKHSEIQVRESISEVESKSDDSYKPYLKTLLQTEKISEELILQTIISIGEKYPNEGQNILLQELAIQLTTNE
ncbi:DUF5107 domain-containing protein [Flexithrix dorotheae]|uniref:DUF5107 domain-containing protein n=1 Tax=Flexithrix dorotheae TaxID=70993 RepID=UPI000366CEF6|nr:DUF5107 domain-containing protein [Flexithrix dorotheae]